MKKVTYFDSLKKIDEKITTNELFKQLYIEIIKFSIEKNDYQGLVKKTATMFDIGLKDALILANDISTDENLRDSWSAIGTELSTYLQLISITYGESIHEIKIYATSENKLLLAETYLSTHESKIGLDLKRIDGDSFYFEMNFGSMVAFTNQVINTFTDMVKRGSISHHDNTYFEKALELRASATWLARSFEPGKGTKGGADSDDGID